jgi:hypothetical protein
MYTFAGLDAQVVDPTLGIHGEVGIRQIAHLRRNDRRFYFFLRMKRFSKNNGPEFEGMKQTINKSMKWAGYLLGIDGGDGLGCHLDLHFLLLFALSLHGWLVWMIAYALLFFCRRNKK